MKSDHFPEIETERLRLRRLNKSDWATISYLRSDEEVNKYVKKPAAESKNKALDFISKIDRGFDVRDIYYSVITEKHLGQMIGSICLWSFSKDKTTAEVGYDLSPTFQGKGMMTESMGGVLEFGFKSLNLDCIEAYTHCEIVVRKDYWRKAVLSLWMAKKTETTGTNVIYEIMNASK